MESISIPDLFRLFNVERCGECAPDIALLNAVDGLEYQMVVRSYVRCERAHNHRH